jgi:hypothetical protein
VAKYNSNGDFIWEKNIGNQYDSKGMKIFLCSTNNLIIGGTINTNLPILIKFNINGNFIEQKSFTGGDTFGSIFVSTTGDIYITGRGTNIDMDLGNTTNILNGNSIVFVGKYSSTFQLIWAKKINTNVVQTCLTVDDMGNVFTAGNTFIINSRILCKLDNNGNLNWLYSYGNCAPTSIDNISINCSGNLLISGIYDYSCNNFNLLGGTNSIQSQGINLNINSNNNFFIACYNSIDCSLIWVKGLQGSNWPTSTFDNNSELKRSRYINIKKTNNFYVTSNFIGATDLDPNPSSVIVNSSTTNYNDVFFAKYSGCNSIGLAEDENYILPNLFPNPTNGIFTISNLKPNAVIEIIDITGRIVFKTQTKNENITIHLNDVEKGIYVYKIIDKQGFVQSGKVVVQ